MDQEFNQLQSFTVEELQKDFDTLIDRVENGESFVIKSEHGNAVMIPYNEVVQILEESGVSEDIIRIHTRPRRRFVIQGNFYASETW